MKLNEKLVIIFLSIMAFAFSASAFDTAQTVTATPITSLPFSINAPGNYFLPADLTSTSPGAAITVNADQVTIDLNGRSLNASGAAKNPFSGFGISVVNHLEVTVQNGHINGFGYVGVILSSAKPNTRSEKNRVEHVDFNDNLLGCFLILSSNTLVENCLFSGGAVGVYDVGGIGDRVQKCGFVDQHGIAQLNQGIGVVSITDAVGGTLIEDCFFSKEKTAGFVQNGPNDKFRFNSFGKNGTNRIGGMEELASDL